MTNKRELNKKLAEWAGFRLECTGVNEETPVWIEPNGVIPLSPTEHFFGEKNYKLPNFTESLDICFKWLVPELGWCDITIGCGTKTEEGNSCHILRNSPEPYCSSVKGESPAMALCLAIGKLID